MYEELEQETRKLNRHHAQVPHGILTWCPRCDRDYVAEQGKLRTCGTCGYRNHKEGKHKFK